MPLFVDLQRVASNATIYQRLGAVLLEWTTYFTSPMLLAYAAAVKVAIWEFSQQSDCTSLVVPIRGIRVTSRLNCVAGCLSSVGVRARSTRTITVFLRLKFSTISFLFQSFINKLEFLLNAARLHPLRDEYFFAFNLTLAEVSPRFFLIKCKSACFAVGDHPKIPQCSIIGRGRSVNCVMYIVHMPQR